MKVVMEHLMSGWFSWSLVVLRVLVALLIELGRIDRLSCDVDDSKGKLKV